MKYLKISDSREEIVGLVFNSQIYSPSIFFNSEEGAGVSIIYNPHLETIDEIEITITEKPQANENDVTITIDNQTTQTLHIYKADDIDNEFKNGDVVSKNAVLNVYPYGEEAVELIIELGDTKTSYSYEDYYNYTMSEDEMIKEITASDNIKITLKYTSE